LDKKVISIKSVLLGVGLAWIIPTFLFGVFSFFGERLDWSWLAVPGMLFLAYSWITQFVYIMPLIYWFRKKGHLGLVRGLWIGAITIIIGNIIAANLYYRMEDKARQGTTKGDIAKYDHNGPIYYTPGTTNKK
jgi:hypothetical protein